MSDATLDRAALERLRRLGGERLLREMVQLFLQLGPERMASATSGSLEAAERACHSLKSSAGNLGAHALQAAAGGAEDAAAARDASAFAAALPALETAYAEAETELTQLLSELT